MIEIIVAMIMYFLCDKLGKYLEKKEADRQYRIKIFKECLRDMGIDVDAEEPESSKRRRPEKARRRCKRLDRETEDYFMFDDINNSMR